MSNKMILKKEKEKENETTLRELSCRKGVLLPFREKERFFFFFFKY